MIARAYCPASLSFIFKFCPHKNLSRHGSIGLGCTIDRGITASISQSLKKQIIFNGQSLNLPTVNTVIESFTKLPVKVEITSEVPLGYGFGVSGANALSCAYALNLLLKRNLNHLQLARIAHKADVLNKTGLGGVATQITGGFVLKTSAGIPPKVVRFPFVGKKLYAIILGGMSTPAILGNAQNLAQINQAAGVDFISLLKPSLSLGEILDISFEFAQKSQLLADKGMIAIIKAIRSRGGHATMTMLGQVVISDTKIQDKNYEILELIITNDTVKLL